MNFVNSNFDEKDTVRKNIQTLISDYKITLKTLSKITRIDYSWLENYMNKKNTLNDLYTNDVYLYKGTNKNKLNDLNTLNLLSQSNLARLIFMLSNGISVANEDERVKSIVDTLISEFEISYETLSIYSNLKIDDIKSFMKDTNSISYEKKYKLAVASLFLHYLFKKPEEIKD